ncbi:hypothetical protein NL526_30570, partial [Klebsiella pneumoniae]|nr:hypothetical protein [Klebsiella pneumoniae]
MYNNRSGNWNSSLGSDALYFNTTGVSNTAIGYQSLLNNNASWNTGVGVTSLMNNTSGYSNVAVG